MKLALFGLAVVLAYSNGAAEPLSGLAVSSAGDRLPALAIELQVRSDLNDSLVHRICAEADAIWFAAGITLLWQHVPANAPPGADRLAVTIDDRPREIPRSHEALGWIVFTPDGPETAIHLSLSSTEDLLRQAAPGGDMTVAMHDILIGRALGRALAHELGHYLLKSKAHRARGLMRASWRSDECFAVGRQGFEIADEERDAAVRLWSE